MSRGEPGEGEEAEAHVLGVDHSERAGRRGTALAASPPAAAMDNEQFAAFYARSARSLWAYLARVSRDPALADDLMQESYVRFLCADPSRGR